MIKKKKKKTFVSDLEKLLSIYRKVTAFRFDNNAVD